MLDFLLDVMQYTVRYGISWMSLILVIIALLRNRKLRKKINKYLPPLLKDDDSEVKSYIQNQHIIMHDIRLIKKHLGVEGECADTSKPSEKNSQTNWFKRFTLLRMGKSTALYVNKNISLRRKKRMREYLKKIGSRKFQAFLTSIVINIASAILFGFGIVNIDEVINAWMPIINMTISTISTWVYIIVEGGIDKENAKGGNINEYAQTDTAKDELTV